MPDINQSSWSETDSSNNAASPNGWTSGVMLPAQVEPTARGMMGAIKRWFNRHNGTQTSGGTANAHTLTYSVAPAGLVAGDTYTFKAGATNTGATTLNVNSLGATTVQVRGLALVGGEIQSGRYHRVIYDGTNFQLQDPAMFYPGGFAIPMKGGVQSGSGAPWSGFLTERSSGQYASDAALWPLTNVAGLHVISELAAAATDPSGAVASDGPRWGLLIDQKTTDTILNSVGLGIINLGYNSGNKVYGANFIVGNNNSGVAATQVTGLEIDLQGAGGATFTEGIEVQAFNGITANCGFRLTGNGTGKYVVGVDLSGGAYTGSALKFGNNQLATFYDTGGTAPMEIYMDASNVMQLVNTATGAGFNLGGTGSDYNVLRLSSDLYINRTSGHGIHFREANGSDQMTIATGGGIFLYLPTANPHVVGQLWANSGIVTVSAG